MTFDDDIGRRAEKIAETFLLNHNLSLRKRNFVTKCGEVDLIMQEGKYCVFVEVKFRKRASHGDVLEQVTPQKQQRIIRAAKLYLIQCDQYDTLPCRFDVVGITPKDHDPSQYHIIWIKDAFSARY